MNHGGWDYSFQAKKTARPGRLKSILSTGVLILGVWVSGPVGHGHATPDQRAPAEDAAGRTDSWTTGSDPHPVRTILQAQAGGGGEGAGQTRDLFEGAGFSDRATAEITRGLDGVVAECRKRLVTTRIDCLGIGLKKVAAKVPAGRNYQAVRRQLNSAGNRLRRIARTNRDPSKSGSTKYIPVKRAQFAAATQAATAVIEEARTKLLRSGESSRIRRVHYQKVARSLGSTTRLLRS